MPLNSIDQILEMDRNNLLHPFAETRNLGKVEPRAYTNAKGINITDQNGKQYIDGVAGLWCVNAGYGRTEIIEAVTEQLNELHYYNPFVDMTSLPAARLAGKLTALAPANLNHVFFSSGGSVANETAIRLAHFYFHSQGRTSKRKIIARTDAYHGSTYLTASLTGIESFHKGFNLLSQGADPLVHHISSPNTYRKPAGHTDMDFCDYLVNEFSQTITEIGADNIACFIAEPIMGAGGVMMAPEGYHKRMWDICKQHDILYISDEVVTAFGRLGHWFVSEEVFGIQPDIICVAKGISSAYMPLGATLYSDAIHSVIANSNIGPEVFSHGFTYSGHPTCCAAGLANIEVIENENILEHVRTVGPVFEGQLRKLNKLPIVGDVRGSHFMMCVEFVRDKITKESFDSNVEIAKRIVTHCYDNGLIVRKIGQCVVLSPPLIINRKEINTVYEKLERAILKVIDDLRNEKIL